MKLPDAEDLMPNLEKQAVLASAKPFDPLTRLENFTNRFPLAMQILRIGGVHPTEDSRLVNPYTGEPDDEVFTNIGEHGFAVACFTQTVAKPLQTQGILTEAEVDQLAVRGLVHDANKRIEIFRRKAVKAGVIEDAYSPKAYETIRPILQAQGIDQESIEYMAQAGSETSHLSLKDFLILDDGMPTLTPGKLIDKLIHLADDMTHTSIPAEGERPLTIYLTPWERMVASDFPTRYPFLWKEGLGFNPDGQIITISDIATADKKMRWVRNYAYWQVFISNGICQEIQGIIDPESKQQPEYFVKELVNSTLIPTA